MRFCRICGQSNQDDAQFCEACGKALNPVGAQPGMPTEPPPATTPEPLAYATPVAAPPMAPPVYAPPAAPPTYAPAAAAPPAPYYGAPVPVSAPAPSAAKTWMPVIVAVLVVALGVAAYFGYTALNPPKPVDGSKVVTGPTTLSAAEYKTRALEFLDDFDAAYATDISTAMGDIASPDAEAQSAAKSVFDDFTQDVRTAAAKVTNLKPPAEYASIHARITKGLEANDAMITALETYIVAAMASAGDPSSLAAAEQAYTDATTSSTLADALADLDAARSELESGTTGTGTTP